MLATGNNALRFLTKKKWYGMLRATKHDKLLRLRFLTKKKNTMNC